MCLNKGTFIIITVTIQLSLGLRFESSKIGPQNTSYHSSSTKDVLAKEATVVIYQQRSQFLNKTEISSQKIKTTTKKPVRVKNTILSSKETTSIIKDVASSSLDSPLEKESNQNMESNTMQTGFNNQEVKKDTIQSTMLKSKEVVLEDNKRRVWSGLDALNNARSSGLTQYSNRQPFQKDAKIEQLLKKYRGLVNKYGPDSQTQQTDSFNRKPVKNQQNPNSDPRSYLSNVNAEEQMEVPNLKIPSQWQKDTRTFPMLDQYRQQSGFGRNFSNKFYPRWTGPPNVVPMSRLKAKVRQRDEPGPFPDGMGPDGAGGDGAGMTPPPGLLPEGVEGEVGPDGVPTGPPGDDDGMSLMQRSSTSAAERDEHKFTTPVPTTTRRRRRTTPHRVSLAEDCDYLAYYCLKAYDTGFVCGRTLYNVHNTFQNYCMLDYVNCMERYDIWQIAHMGECFDLKILSEYRFYPYNDDYFLDNYYIIEDM